MFSYYTHDLFPICVFFFKQKTAYEVRISDWSSDVCSSDLELDAVIGLEGPDPGPGHGTGTVKLLFDEATSEEKTYFHRFGVFPIIHVLSLNRSVLKNVHDEREQLITQLTDAFDSYTATATADRTSAS